MTKDRDEPLISGLLRKRHQLSLEAVSIRDKLAEVSSAIDSIDHVLATLGRPPAKGFEPHSGQVIMFKRHELKRFVLDCLREADCKPITTTDIAAQFMAMDGRDYTDRRVRSTIIKKIGKTLKALREQGIAESSESNNTSSWLLVVTRPL